MGPSHLRILLYNCLALGGLAQTYYWPVAHLFLVNLKAHANCFPRLAAPDASLD